MVTDAPRIGVLALQGDADAHAQALSEAGAIPVPVRLPAQLADLAGLAIPGGESSALLELIARDGLFDALKTFAATMPVFGTCAGCILLARRVLVASPRAAGGVAKSPVSGSRISERSCLFRRRLLI